MAVRIGLVVALATLLAGCGALHCAENSQNTRVDGACGIQQTF